MHHSESSLKNLVRHLMFSMMHRKGLTKWERFLQTPIGKLKMHYSPSDEYRLKAKEMFMIGFGHGYFDGRFPDPDCILDSFEFNWAMLLDCSEGHVLLCGTPYPDTSPAILKEAKQYYRFGYTYGLNWGIRMAADSREPSPSIDLPRPEGSLVAYIIG